MPQKAKILSTFVTSLLCSPCSPCSHAFLFQLDANFFQDLEKKQTRSRPSRPKPEIQGDKMRQGWTGGCAASKESAHFNQRTNIITLVWFISKGLLQESSNARKLMKNLCPQTLAPKGLPDSLIFIESHSGTFLCIFMLHTSMPPNEHLWCKFGQICALTEPNNRSDSLQPSSRFGNGLSFLPVRFCVASVSSTPMMFCSWVPMGSMQALIAAWQGRLFDCCLSAKCHVYKPKDIGKTWQNTAKPCISNAHVTQNSKHNQCTISWAGQETTVASFIGWWNAAGQRPCKGQWACLPQVDFGNRPFRLSLSEAKVPKVPTNHWEETYDTLTC